MQHNSLFNFGAIDRTKVLGADTGALYYSSPEAEKHAERYYEFCRKAKEDYKTIAKNTGFREQDIKRIKDHIFFDNHKLYDGIVGKFDPSYDMAQSWQRLAEHGGKRIEENDIIMLNHEFYENVIEKADNLTYREAHDKTDLLYSQ